MELHFDYIRGMVRAFAHVHRVVICLSVRFICLAIQIKTNNDIREMDRSNNFFISADKFRNIYRINKNRYEKLMHDNVTKTYKKCNNDKIKTINIKAKKIASKLKLEDRIQVLVDNDAYISIKDNKEGFPDKNSCRLINQTKIDIGKISKHILDKVNTSILEKTKTN